MARSTRERQDDVWAHNLVNDAVERGSIVRPTKCEECGAEPPRRRDGGTQIEAHHDDYNRPLEVRFLCKSCHRKWHGSHAPVLRAEDDDPVEALLRDL